MMSRPTTLEPPKTKPIPTTAGRSRQALLPLIPTFALVVLVVVVTVIQPSFLSIGSIQTQLIQTAPILILALGLTPVIVIGGIDLSIGALASVSAILLSVFAPGLGAGGVGIVVVLAVATGGLVGYVHAWAQIPSFVVTLGALGAYSGLALVISNSSSRSLGAGSAALAWMNGTIALVPMTFLVAVVVMAVLGGVLRYTTWGRRVYAIGSGEAASVMSGIATVRVKTIAFAVCGGCAALAACFLTARTGYAAPDMADSYLLPAIAAVLVGGTAISGGVGSVWRTFVGALILTVLQAGLIVVGTDPVVLDLAFGALIIVAVAMTTDRGKVGIVK